LPESLVADLKARLEEVWAGNRPEFTALVLVEILISAQRAFYSPFGPGADYRSVKSAFFGLLEDQFGFDAKRAENEIRTKGSWSRQKRMAEDRLVLEWVFPTKFDNFKVIFKRHLSLGSEMAISWSVRNLEPKSWRQKTQEKILAFFG